MDSDKEIKNIDIDNIIPNRFQPRLTFDPNALNELSESIKQYGIFQPLVVRKVGNKYEIIAGERRYKASTMLGLKEVPCIIVDLDDNESAEIALVENIQRKDLTAIEEAKSYKKLLDRGYINQEQLAKRMGKSQPSVANKIRLLNLSEEVQNALLENKISERHARSLLTLKEDSQQNEMLSRIINEKLTVRNTDLEIRKLINPEVENKEPDFIPVEEEANTINVENLVKPREENSLSSPKPDILDLLKKEEMKDLPEIKIEKEEDVQEKINLNPKDLIKGITLTPVEAEPDFIPVEKDLIEPVKIENLVTSENLPLNEETSVGNSKYVTNNIKTAINTARECVNTLEKYGFIVEKNELDLEKEYQITIKIKKAE